MSHGQTRTCRDDADHDRPHRARDHCDILWHRAFPARNGASRGAATVLDMPAWIPARVLIDYVTGAALLVGGGSLLVNWKPRTVATSWGVGGWILLLVVVVYPRSVLVDALATPKMGVQMAGINYFFDTLLFAGAILALAGAMLQNENRYATKSNLAENVT